MPGLNRFFVSEYSRTYNFQRGARAYQGLNPFFVSEYSRTQTGLGAVATQRKSQSLLRQRILSDDQLKTRTVLTEKLSQSLLRQRILSDYVQPSRVNGGRRCLNRFFVSEYSRTLTQSGARLPKNGVVSIASSSANTLGRESG